MKALKIACDEFLKGEADIQNFDINISTEPNQLNNGEDGIFVVTFMGKLFPGKRGLGAANRFPGSATYFVSKKEWRIIKEQGVKRRYDEPSLSDLTAAPQLGWSGPMACPLTINLYFQGSLMKNLSLPLISSLMLFALALPASAARNIPASAFFDAAICKPAYSFRHANDIYDAAEKLGKPDTSSGAAVYHLPAPIKKDGFIAVSVVFASSTIGVLIEGNVAEKLAKHYNLAPQKENIINMSGFARQLPDAQQGMKELGKISLVALKSSAFKHKTLLACQFVSNEDQKNMDLLSED